MGDDHTEQAVLLEDHYAPITSTIGFLNIGFERIVDAVLASRGEQFGQVDATQLQGPLGHRLLHLQPLTITQRREMWIECADPQWIAVFTSGVNGSDPVGRISHYAKQLNARGLIAVSKPTATSGQGLGRWVSRQFQMFGPRLELDSPRYVRTVSVTQDGSKWRFDQSGTVQDFEDPSAYRRRRIAERLTPQMLIDYCAALGVHPFEEGFYSGDTALIVSPDPDPLPPSHMELSLAEARTRLGLTPADPPDPA